MEQIIFKIKELQKIEPEKNWIRATKAHILSQEIGTGLSSSGFRFDFNFFSSKAVLALPAMLAVLLMGIFFYNKNTLDYKITAADLERLESITNDLRTVESGIVRTTSNLGSIEKPERVLELREMVGLALKNGGKVVGVTKKMAEIPTKSEDPAQVFAVMSNVEQAAESVEYALQDMEETYWQKQKELAKDLIEDLEKRSLTENQALLLEQAKNDYNEGKFDQALVKVIEVSQ